MSGDVQLLQFFIFVKVKNYAFQNINLNLNFVNIARCVIWHAALDQSNKFMDHWNYLSFSFRYQEKGITRQADQQSRTSNINIPVNLILHQIPIGKIRLLQYSIAVSGESTQ